MIIASKANAQKIANRGNAADAVNQAVLAATGGRLPCYAIPGKRVAFKWISVGSSSVIPRSEAARFLTRVGINIDIVEAS